MSFLERAKLLKELFAKQWDVILMACVVILVIGWSLSTLTTKPKIWTDEAVNIDIAHSFFTYGVLSPQTAPQTFFKFPHLIQSTGYPTTVPLAGFFKLFGYGLVQARIFMLGWILAALILTFFLARKLFSKFEAVCAVLLIASFASFYANGRTVTGEIPGFFFLLIGFYFLLIRKHYFFTGIVWGLAVVAKPSVFGLIIPTIFLTLFLERLPWKDFFERLGAIAVGMVPAAILWIVFVVQNPFEAHSWKQIISFYKNPYSTDISLNMSHNLFGFFHSTTLIYFGGLFLFIVLARLFLARVTSQSFLYSFILFYSILAFVYYLRSPGYLRYILVAELLILFVLPHVVGKLVSWFVRHRGWAINHGVFSVSILGGLILMQGVQMFTIADISSSDSASRVAAYLNEHFPKESIGLVNAYDIGVSIDHSRTFLAIDLLGLPPVGDNPILLSSPPDIIVSYPSNRFIDEGKKVLAERYAPVESLEGYVVFKKVR